MMEDILGTLVNVSIGSGIIWGAVMVFKRTFGTRISPRLHLAVWIIFLCRLLVPVSFEVAYPEVFWPAETGNVSTVTESAPEAVLKHGVESTPLKTPTGNTNTPQAIAPETMRLQPSVRAQTFARTVRWTEIFVFVWIGGAGCFAASALRAYWQLRRDALEYAAPPPRFLELLFAQYRKELGVKGKVRLSVQAGKAGPALLFPSIVLIPNSILSGPEREVEMALRHELTHYRRHDHILALLLCVLRVIYWFNPFVWLAVNSIREDMETACDHDVLNGLGTAQRAAYATSVLSMYRRADTPQRMLAMASGSGRRHVENRIKRMYMPSKSRRSAKIVAVLLAAVLGAVCFTSGCQPTPETEAVVNRQESETAYTEGELELGSHYSPVGYAVSERWEDSIERDGVSVEADVDVLLPDVSEYAAEELQELELTQDKVKQMAAYFAGDEYDLVQLPLARSKASWEAELLELEQAKAGESAEGADAASLQFYDDRITEVKQQIQNAPEKPNMNPATLEFTQEYDTEGNALPGSAEDYIEVGIVREDGAGVISASRERVTARTPPSFNFSSVNEVWTKGVCQEMLDVSEETGDTETGERIRKAAKVMDEYDLQPEAQEQRAIQVLEELGIAGVQITGCEKAAFSSLDDLADWGSAGNADFLPGVFISYTKEVDGVPCTSQSEVWSMDEGQDATGYRPPFLPETGDILLDKNGKVISFSWRSMTQVVPDSLGRVEILPFEEVEGRIADQLYYAAKATYDDSWSITYSPTQVKLVSAYVEAPNDPNAVRVVPAWEVQTDSAARTDQDVFEMEGQKFLFSAIDGSPILMPVLEDGDYQ